MARKKIIHTLIKHLDNPLAILRIVSSALRKAFLHATVVKRCSQTNGLKYEIARNV